MAAPALGSGDAWLAEGDDLPPLPVGEHPAEEAAFYEREHERTAAPGLVLAFVEGGLLGRVARPTGQRRQVVALGEPGVPSRARARP